VYGTAGISGLASQGVVTTFTAATSALNSTSVWGIEYEATTLQSRTNSAAVPQLFYSQGATNWNVTMSINPVAGGANQSIGYTIRYYYK
jgi:hypothetical protein